VSAPPSASPPFDDADDQSLDFYPGDERNRLTPTTGIDTAAPQRTSDSRRASDETTSRSTDARAGLRT
jgi:hypothetical protein